MERLMAPLAKCGWESLRACRALGRRFGIGAPILLACAACMVGALVFAHFRASRAALLETRLAARAVASAPARPDLVRSDTPAAGEAGARARLGAFDAQLLAHADIPFVVQELLDLGAAEGLSMQRGSYRPQADRAGGFMRFRMTLPVKGSGPAIQRFMKAALRKQRNLALDSVQFTRARIGSSDIEARVQWVLLATLPAAEAE